MSQDAEFIRAFFEIVSGPDQGTRIDVHFNPGSLQYQITNTLQQQGEDVRQYVSQSTGKLTLDLLFDTTGTGQDVRNDTVKMAKLMEPVEPERIPPVVKFEWGAYAFQGMVESYRETLEFFSANGVPLRAGVNLTLASQRDVFAGGSDRSTDVAGTLPGSGAVEMEVPPGMAGGTRGSPADLAARAGSPGASREIAAQNGLDSLRFAAGGSVTVGGGARAGAGPLSLSAGVSAGAEIRVGAGASGLDPARLVRERADAGLATDRGAAFGPGGRARVETPPSLGADVGAGATLSARVRFEGA